MPIRERLIQTAHAAYQRIRRFIHPEYPAAAFHATQEAWCRHRCFTVVMMMGMFLAWFLIAGPTIIHELSSPDMKGFVVFLIGFCLFLPLYYGLVTTISFFIGECLFASVWFVADKSLVRASRVTRKELRLAEILSVEYEDHPRRGFVFRLHVAMQEPGASADSWDIVDVDNRVGLFSAIRPHLSPSIPIRKTAWYSMEWSHAMKKAVLLFAVSGAALAAIVYFSYPYL